jgi:hypothetical protein
MNLTLTEEQRLNVSERLWAANVPFNARIPGEWPSRQPVHTVYGGAHIYRAETAMKLGELARAAMKDYAPTAGIFTKAFGIEGSPAYKSLLYNRVSEKLRLEPVEDFRIDFEDGYGYRADEEEDRHAVHAAAEMARGMSTGILPPFCGIRIKPFTEELKGRAIRTLDLFLTALLESTRGVLPDNFVVTLPKITIPEQIGALVEIFTHVEHRHRLPSGMLRMEIMIETPQALISPSGGSALPAFVRAADGRCIAAHFGVFDYTSALRITAAHQRLDHPACDFARHMMQVGLAGTGIFLADGATNVLPIGPHRAAGNARLSVAQQKENKDVVLDAWKLAFDNTTRSLASGFYQGWDLHPAQLPARYAAVYDFFLQGLDAASLRLRTFMERAAQASLVGNVFDDAASGQGLLNYFLRGISCGAITEAEAAATGLTLEEIHMKSFAKILAGRRARHQG